VGQFCGTLSSNGRANASFGSLGGKGGLRCSATSSGSYWYHLSLIHAFTLVRRLSSVSLPFREPPTPPRTLRHWLGRITTSYQKISPFCLFLRCDWRTLLLPVQKGDVARDSAVTVKLSAWNGMGWAVLVLKRGRGLESTKGGDAAHPSGQRMGRTHVLNCARFLGRLKDFSAF
jgi:hypothetical protein